MQRFFRSSFGVNLGLTIGSVIPPRLGYKIAFLAGKLLAARTKSPMVQAIRANQIIIRGEQTSPEEIDHAVEEVLIHAGRCFIDLYHNLKNPVGLKSLSPLNPRLEELIIASHDKSFGAFIVAPHLSNFDLVLLAAGYRGLSAQILTYGNPSGGYKIQNEIRAQTGLNITPVNQNVHAQAIENMRTGGFVVTAVDRPIKRKAHYMNFFGQPSPLPAGHINMALEAEVPIIVAAAEYRADELYHVHFSEPIELTRKDDSDETIRFNGEAVLQVIENYIRRAPGQWLMYYPAWPNRNENVNR